MTSQYKKNRKCRICGGKKLETILDLGKTPPANAFLSKKDLKKREIHFPLVLIFCNKCFLVQLGHSVNPDILFHNYHYNTGASKPLVNHFKKMAGEISKNYLASKDDLVVEFGSNDGVLIGALKDKHRVLGVDPAENVAKLAHDRGVETIIDYFGKRSAKQIRKKFGPARVIVANNVFAHIDDIHDVLGGVHALLHDDGHFIFECHWVGNLINHGGFDQIYHEHLFYYSLHSLQTLLDTLGMIIKDVKLMPIHGESLRVYVGKSGESNTTVKEFLKREKEIGLTNRETYQSFGEKVQLNKEKLTDLLIALKKIGKTIVGYGAPGKSTTLLNFLKIGPDILDFITDTTSAKQGTYTPGTHIPIIHPKILTEKKPDYILLLSWNYADAILEKEK
ncbi:MAG: class I SAM-dependent methyltransferase, partial [bacterium]|nr:class I SAM-dependent methyltransferase [bacterium]